MSDNLLSVTGIGQSRACPNSTCPNIINNSCGGIPVVTAATQVAVSSCGCATPVSNTCLVPTPTADHIYALSLAPQVVCPGSSIPFDTNRVISGTALTHVEGSADFVTIIPGNYQIIFSTIATPSLAGSTMASVAIGLNDQVISGTTAMETAVQNQQVNLTTQAIITVNCREAAKISVINMSGTQTIFSD
ncbi:MAG: hypothetical protein RR490_07545, partial [Niameybacter sp.]